ncbi:MAG: hypothetical protein WA765_07100 [Candidatus Acidiferrum sp.]
MNLKIRLYLGSGAIAGTLLFASFSGAQQNQTPAAQTYTSYELSRESTVTGKVLSYTAASAVPPIGAHMSIQTAYGPVDVHLGSAKLLEQKGLTLNVGDSVSVTGEVISFGQSSTFAARIVEDGDKSITVRDTKGRLILTTPVHVVRGAR